MTVSDHSSEFCEKMCWSLYCSIASADPFENIRVDRECTDA
jgi:hypothetical protein